MTNAATAAAPIARPQQDEYIAYYHKYITLVPEGDLVEALRSQIGETLSLVRSIPEARGSHRYARG